MCLLSQRTHGSMHRKCEVISPPGHLTLKVVCCRIWFVFTIEGLQQFVIENSTNWNRDEGVHMFVFVWMTNGIVHQCITAERCAYSVQGQLKPCTCTLHRSLNRTPLTDGRTFVFIQFVVFIGELRQSVENIIIRRSDCCAVSLLLRQMIPKNRSMHYVHVLYRHPHAHHHRRIEDYPNWMLYTRFRASPRFSPLDGDNRWIDKPIRRVIMSIMCQQHEYLLPSVYVPVFMSGHGVYTQPHRINVKGQQIINVYSMWIVNGARTDTDYPWNRINRRRA